MTRCPKCNNMLPAPREHPDSLAGVLHDICNSCGWSRAITKKARRERLPAPTPTED